MIGLAVKKYAEAHGMCVDKGCAYGRVNGWLITLRDGAGSKQLYIYCPVTGEETEKQAKYALIQQILGDCEQQKYRLSGGAAQAISVAEGVASVIFLDTIGTMKCVAAYIDEVVPKLDALGLNTEICAECHQPLDSHLGYVQLGGAALPVHTDCIRSLSDHVETEAMEEKPGSVLRGILGAGLGALAGAIVWALVLSLGYITSLVGLLMGALSSMLYTKLGGKRSKISIVIVALAVVLGLLLGQVGGYTLTVLKEYDDSVELSKTEIVQTFWDYMLLDQNEALGKQYDRIVAGLPEEQRDSEEIYSRDEFIQMNRSQEDDEIYAKMRKEFVTDSLLGLLFCVLGCFGVFRTMYHATRRRKVKELE